MTKDQAVEQLVYSIAQPLLDAASNKKPPKELIALTRTACAAKLKLEKEMNALGKKIGQIESDYRAAAKRLGFRTGYLSTDKPRTRGWYTQPDISALSAKIARVTQELQIRVSLGSPIQVEEFTKLIQEALK